MVEQPSRVAPLSSIRSRASATLAPEDKLAFTALQSTLKMTTGNLSTYLTKLEEAGYTAIEKTFEGRKPATYVWLTAGQAFDTYLAHLRNLLKQL